MHFIEFRGRRAMFIVRDLQCVLVARWRQVQNVPSVNVFRDFDILYTTGL